MLGNPSRSSEPDDRHFPPVNQIVEVPQRHSAELGGVLWLQEAVRNISLSWIIADSERHLRKYPAHEVL